MYLRPHCPVPGPVTVVALFTRYLEHGGDPLRLFAEFCRGHGITRGDRVFHELRVIMNCFWLAGTYGQLNVGSLVSFELLARRAQAIDQAYKHGSGGEPNFGTAHLFMGEDAGEVEKLIIP